MDNLLSRHRNLTVLVVVLFAQVVGLAVQVKRASESGSVRLVRVWTIGALTPVEKGFVHTREWVHNTWQNYFYLRGVRKENEELRQQIEQMRLQQIRMQEDASQARRLQALLGFKEQYIQQTLPAQVISTTGSEFSRGIYIDKGAQDGLKNDMAVITVEGVVGKIYRVYPNSSLVLLINDPSSGAGVILEKSRLQGILRGTPSGETVVQNIMSDEKLEVGEPVITSGGDRIFPKGLPVGVVTKVDNGPDLFLNVRIKPAAPLSRLEEVLVISKIVEKTPDTNEVVVRQRAADILAERLPTVPPKPPDTPAKPAAGGQPAAGPLPDAGGAKPTPPAKPSGTPGSPSVGRPSAIGNPGAAMIAKPQPATGRVTGTAGNANPAVSAPDKVSAPGLKPAAAAGAATKPVTNPGSAVPGAGQSAVQTKSVAPAGATPAKPSAAGTGQSKPLAGANAAAEKPKAGSTTDKKPAEAAKPEPNKPAKPTPKDGPPTT